MNGPKMTLQTQLVLRQALQEPDREWYGLQMIAATGLPAGTVYPIVARLERCGWIQSRWEDPAEHEAEGRPRRRYYRFTTDGAEQARVALARAYRSRRTAAVPAPWPALPGQARTVTSRAEDLSGLRAALASPISTNCEIRKSKSLALPAM